MLWWVCHCCSGGCVTVALVGVSLLLWWVCHCCSGGCVTVALVGVSLLLWWVCHCCSGGCVTVALVGVSLLLWWVCHCCSGGCVTVALVGVSLLLWCCRYMEAMCHILKQLDLLWRREFVSLLFTPLLALTPAAEPSTTTIKKGASKSESLLFSLQWNKGLI